MYLSYEIEAVSQALKEVDNAELTSVLKVVKSRATTLSDNVSGLQGQNSWETILICSVSSPNMLDFYLSRKNERILLGKRV